MSSQNFFDMFQCLVLLLLRGPEDFGTEIVARDPQPLRSIVIIEAMRSFEIGRFVLVVVISDELFIRWIQRPDA